MKTKNFITLGIFLAVIILLIFAGPKMEKTGETIKEFNKTTAKATFAGGCFWCMEGAFQDRKGVINVVSGYTGGSSENPTYQEVASGDTGHYEAIEIIYDPKKISYEELLNIFWRNIDPTDEFGQFIDKGPQYKTAIFYNNETQKELAEKSKADLDSSGKFDKPIATKIVPLEEFYKAEDYHQDFYKKRSLQYQIYEKGSGRKETLKDIWG